MEANRGTVFWDMEKSSLLQRNQASGIDVSQGFLVLKPLVEC